MSLQRIFLVVVALLWLTYASAEDTPERLLVTISDPGLSQSARTGPFHPMYPRHASSYLVSVTVKRKAARIAHDFDLRIVDEWPIAPLQVHCLVYEAKTGADIDALLEELRMRPEIESAQRLNRFDVSATPSRHGDPYLKLQHNLLVLDVAGAHHWSRGNGVHITIIDTGADLDHPELRSRIEAWRDFVGDDPGRFATDAHGTAVAGVIGANADNGIGMIGVAPSSRLTILKACWYTDTTSSAVCDSFTLAKALASVLESHTDILNLSLSGPADPLLERLLGIVVRRGTVVVVADSTRGIQGFPEAVPGVIVAASIVSEDPGKPQRLLAPAEEILVPVPGGGFDYASGSSLSAAQVSGIAALLIARQPGLGVDDVTRLLVASRLESEDPVNACRAVAALLGESGCEAVAEGL